MDIVIIILTTIDVIVALLLIALILVQQSKEGGFGSAFGSVGESVFGAHAGSHLTRLTVIFASIFLVVTLTLAIITGHRKPPKSAVEKEMELTSQSSKGAEEKKKAEKTEEVALGGDSGKQKEVVKEEIPPENKTAEKSETDSKR